MGSYRGDGPAGPPGARECWGCGDIFRNGVELYKHCKEFGHFKHAPKDDRFSPPPIHRKRFGSPVDSPPTRPRGSFRNPNDPTYLSPPRSRDYPPPNPNSTPLQRPRQPYELYSSAPKDGTFSGAKPPPRAPAREMYPTRESYDLFTPKNKELSLKPERSEAHPPSVLTSIPLQKSIEPKSAEARMAIEPASPSAGFMARFRHAALKSDDDLKTELKAIESYWRQKITDETERIAREKEKEIEGLKIELEKGKLQRASEDTMALREELKKEKSQRKYLEVLSQSYEVLKKVQETRIEQLESANKKLNGNDAEVEKETTSYSSMMEREASQAASKKRLAEEEESGAAKKTKVWDGKTEREE